MAGVPARSAPPGGDPPRLGRRACHRPTGRPCFCGCSASPRRSTGERHLASARPAGSLTGLGRVLEVGSVLASRCDDRVVGRGDLSDEQWAALEPLLPITALGRPMVGRRRLIDGVRWRVRTGAPWRDLPREYGPWQTVYGFFRRWQRDGTWSALLTRLQTRADAAGLIIWEVNVDSTICRAHQHAAGARRDGNAQNESPGGARTEPHDHGLGRFRGGWTTKIHLACE
ncbi:IS5 family transposase [Streptomyces sp. NPDC005281]|uniref:IS5 family transposase n=1 Tax=Streptomyces sp. NPDC005281 TaxID=3155712 RepID=UPI0033B4FB72